MKDETNLRRTKLRKRTMKMATWNVQGVRGKVQEIVKQVEEMDVDKVVLTETKKKGQGLEEIGNYLHLYSGVKKEERTAKGESVLVKKKYKTSLTNFECINDRIIKIYMNIFNSRIAIRYMQ